MNKKSKKKSLEAAKVRKEILIETHGHFRVVCESLKKAREEIEIALLGIENELAAIRSHFPELHDEHKSGWVVLKYPAGPIYGAGWDKEETIDGFHEDCELGLPDSPVESQVLEYHEREGEYEPVLILEASRELVEWVQFNGTTDKFSINDGIAILTENYKQ